MARRRKKKKADKKKSKKTAAKSESTSSNTEHDYYGRSERLFELVAVSPLFFGAWLSGGFVLADIKSFVMVTVAFAAAFYGLRVSLRPALIFPGSFKIILYASQLLLLLLLYQFTQSALLTGIVALGVITIFLPYALPYKKRTILILIFAAVLMLRSVVFGYAGIYSQVHSVGGQLFWQFLALGLPAGMVLAAAVIATNAEDFLNAGWKRMKEVQVKGETVNRPAGLSKLYFLLVILGPGIPVIIVPLGLVPPAFLLLCLTYFVMPKLLENFAEHKLTNDSQGVVTARFAGGVSVLCFLSGLAARQLI